jgi:hypothetical protein
VAITWVSAIRELCEAREVWSGGIHIDHAGRFRVLPEISEDIDQRTTHSARRGECPPVPAIRDELPPSKHQPIDPPRKTHRQSSHAVPQRLPIDRLYEQVNVAVLNREV